MGVIEPADKSVKELKGLHLYHTGRSTCASRVRLLIEEKELPWTSHYIDLYLKENVTPEYFAINPKGVVPTLIDDGQVIVELNEILLYLEEKFPRPSFTPRSATDREAMRAWLERSADIHIPGVKTFAYAKMNAALVQKTEQEAAFYRSLQKDPDLLAFHAKHDPGKSFSDEDVDGAAALLRVALGEIEANIARSGWIAGDSYSLADMSWATNIATLKRAKFPLEDFPNLLAWHERISDRPAWKRTIDDWEEPRRGVVVVRA